MHFLGSGRKRGLPRRSVENPFAMLRTRTSQGVLLALACLPLVAQTVRFARCVRTGRVLSRSMLPFERRLLGAGVTLLVAGDSTAVGTGAADAQETLAGLLAADFPSARIINVAEVGARVADLPRQLAAYHGRCDALIMAIGGNDVLRFTPRDALAPQARVALEHARARADVVVLAGSPNVGLAPAFFWPVRNALARRTRAVRDILRAACREAGAHHVDFFAEENDLFSRDPGRFFAADLLHPSSASYRYCYEVIRRSTPLASAARLRPGSPARTPSPAPAASVGGTA